MKMRSITQLIPARRKAFAVFAAAALLLSACSGAGASEQTETPAAEETPVTISTAAGDTASSSDNKQDKTETAVTQEETAGQTDAAAENPRPVRHRFP